MLKRRMGWILIVALVTLLLSVTTASADIVWPGPGTGGRTTHEPISE
ncbi:MAG: hypothetical protein ACOY94_16270 [Bacillota bacterium]